MIAEAIDKIKDLCGVIPVAEVNELPYTSLRSLVRIRLPHQKPPMVQGIHTLTGLVDCIRYHAGKDLPALDELIVHVVNETTVRLISLLQQDNDNERFCYVEAELAHNGFAFDRPHDQEKFLVGLFSLFVQDDTRNALIGMVSSIVDDQSAAYEDDGISQTVAVKSGIRTAKKITITNPITLRPYRTFREVEQPASAFVLRIRKDPVRIALYEADGGAWRLAAIENIKSYLEGQLPNAIVWG